MNNNLTKYEEKTIMLDEPYGRSMEGTEIKYYTENGNLKKIVESVYVEFRGGEAVTEYYIKDGFPYFFKSVFTGTDESNADPNSEIAFYFELKNNGTVGELFRIVHNGAIDDGESNEEFFDRGVLRDFSSLLYIIEEKGSK